MCDFNLVLGRQGGQAGIPLASFFSTPPHRWAVASLSASPSLVPAWTQGLLPKAGVICP